MPDHAMCLVHSLSSANIATTPRENVRDRELGLGITACIEGNSFWCFIPNPVHVLTNPLDGHPATGLAAPCDDDETEEQWSDSDMISRLR